MEFKTKSHTFNLLSADVAENDVAVTFCQNGETLDELIDIFKSADETETMYADTKELTGYTEFVSLQYQNNASTNEDSPELLAIVRLKKPDLTAEKLKAAITYLGVMNGNTEVTEVLNE